MPRCAVLRRPGSAWCLHCDGGDSDGLAGVSGFKALAEFGLILTVGMFMMMIHTLLMVPALLGLWWRVPKPRARRRLRSGCCRGWRGRAWILWDGMRAVVGLGLGMFLLLLVFLPRSGWERTSKSPAPTIRRRSRRTGFRRGLELRAVRTTLDSGGEQEVLRRAEESTTGLEDTAAGRAQVDFFADGVATFGADAEGTGGCAGGREFRGFGACARRCVCAKTDFGLSRCSRLLNDCGGWGRARISLRWKMRGSLCRPGCSITAFARREMGAMWRRSLFMLLIRTRSM